ncbi:MAG: PilW family protein [Planctomycetota bacterium]|jgi:Tfp pilus assembly protein PilE
MGCGNTKNKVASGLTLLEMVLAVAILVIVSAALLPQFRAVQNSWDTRAGDAETRQNARILMDHLHRNLSKAARVTAVTAPSQTNGYIEFRDNDGNSFRYDVNATTSYVRFGPVATLADLAGPVCRLQFTCYDAFDLSTPIADVNAVRSVKVEATLINPAHPDRDMTFTTQAYIRTNNLPAAGGNISKLSEPWLGFDPLAGMEPALVHMTGTNYLCAYRGDRDDGCACILTVNTGDWSVSSGSFLEYGTKQGVTPALAKIDDNYALCAYQGDKGDGFACILFQKIPGTLQRGVPLEFDSAGCIHPVLSKIYTEGNTHHFLCAYFDNASSVRTVVLTAAVTDVLTDVTSGPTMSFACDLVCQPALTRIDDTHYLCAYRGSNLRLWAVVLTVTPATWTVTTETPFEVAPTLYAYEPALARIDDAHYLYAFHSNIDQGCAVVLTVNTGNWTITNGTAYPYYQFSEAAASVELCKIDRTNFLCAYGGGFDSGLATVLTVDTGDWSLSHKPPFTFEPGTCAELALCRIDAVHYLCAHAGLGNAGYAGVLDLGTPVLP